ncbi:MAG: NADPH-dependent 7-cyano-7-deazaguanine reductase QueF [Ignavibacteriaceae bacterium]|nr:NADPH-dependent 7-cyano-7-deazaguanine reductase QueF [Ignavibacteriaceae bacterium]HMN23866.1 preQ(1) synthase [Ignavibacteriaceae bacterium]HRN26434.1 preQ(1) synthase [Ignavibacteriaceae bacterium]HRP92027.1 preQ(1) synthase [Ignavibacteriaceae bacterium]HRQ53961.1 preQ(1) synthase [Ignavibacteriaceae bacterium]
MTSKLKIVNNKLSLLETFENQYTDRDYTVKHIAPEFTSLCPKTGQPDFATITLEYVPDLLCVELKSFKFYLQSYRNDGIFFESVTNKILDDLVEVTQPRFMRITAKFNTRGGISSVIEAEYENEDYWDFDDDEFDDDDFLTN